MEIQNGLQVLTIPSNEIRYHQVPVYDAYNNDDIGQVQVIIGLPERVHRARNDWMWMSINGRIVEQSIFQEVFLLFQ